MAPVTAEEQGHWAADDYVWNPITLEAREVDPQGLQSSHPVSAQGENTQNVTRSPSAVGTGGERAAQRDFQGLNQQARARRMRAPSSEREVCQVRVHVACSTSPS